MPQSGNIGSGGEQRQVPLDLLRQRSLIDEAQELQHTVLTEMRLLASTDFDSRAILSVVFSGDNRRLDKLRTAELKFRLASRIRQRLVMPPLKARDEQRFADPNP